MYESQSVSTAELSWFAVLVPAYLSVGGTCIASANLVQAACQGLTRCTEVWVRHPDALGCHHVDRGADTAGRCATGIVRKKSTGSSCTKEHCSFNAAYMTHTAGPVQSNPQVLTLMAATMPPM
jgi:hypothetical protein